MKLNLRPTPRTFTVNEITIKDHGEIELESDEMVTFVTTTGKHYDFTAKEWGYYATPSINGRLKQQGFKTALVENSQGRIYVMIIEENKIQLFSEYCNKEKQTVLQWLNEHQAMNC